MALKFWVTMPKEETKMLKLNLQQFAGDDDMILPDDFTDTPSDGAQGDQQTDDAILPDDEGADTIPPTEEQPDAEQPETPKTEYKLPLKYNGEERLVGEEEARVLAQKGMNYEKAIERAAQEARDAVYANMGLEWNGKSITTEAEYKQAVAEKELLDKLPDVPEDVRKELLESRRFREQYQEQQKQLETQKRQEADFADFVAAFPEVDPKTIKPETWEKANNGLPLKYAFMEQERAELLTRVKVQEQNEQNKQKAPVRGVAAYGTGEEASDPFLEGFDSIN